ncbi:hypothetical protein G9F72_023760 [Clostridium estertheticum]|nr:hypothetical protein [Clostridium estertheticum]MBZ9689316.1 hypothetical protein [Clostridium estertheticum]
MNNFDENNFMLFLITAQKLPSIALAKGLGFKIKSEEIAVGSKYQL